MPIALTTYRPRYHRRHLRQRQNDNLEQQAQALFRSWFIDYLPFNGLRPQDWEVRNMGEVCSCVLGGTPNRSIQEYWGGNISWINSGEVNRFRITTPSETITELGVKKSATKLLPAKTTVLAITGATLGQYSLLEIDSCANQSVVGIVPNNRMPYEFIYPFIKENIELLLSHQTGGAQQHINKQNVEDLEVAIPSIQVMESYRHQVAPMYELIAQNCFEIEKLNSLRDELLPKLMSGELKIEEMNR